jgi:hypothetical protein
MWRSRRNASTWVGAIASMDALSQAAVASRVARVMRPYLEALA